MTQDRIDAQATRARHQALQRAGVAASARVRNASTDAGIERIRALWALPALEWPTYVLRLVASDRVQPRAYNTLVARLGWREPAQARHMTALASSKCQVLDGEDRT